MSQFFVQVAALFSVISGMNEQDIINLENRNPPPLTDINNDLPADRIYYIACKEVLWDYAPSGRDNIRGEEITAGTTSDVWLYPENPSNNRIGRKYIKGLYREFTDKTFTKEKHIDAKWKHMGAIGPLIRAIEGETIKIFYKNDCSFKNSMHPHGVQYDKTSEGAPYDDGDLTGDIIHPGQEFTYIWKARQNSVDKFHSSKIWLYHSHVDEIRDIHTGLIGPIVITRLGAARKNDEDYYRRHWSSNSDAVANDIDREFVNYFVLYDESESLLFEKNLDRLRDANGGFITGEAALLEDEDFIESNLMHSINGYLFGNIPKLQMINGEIVRWFLASFGNEADSPHSPHWHGNIAKSNDEYTDTVLVIAGTTKTADMRVDSTGKWLYHCHVFDHIEAGMIDVYTVVDGHNLFE